MDTNDLSIIFTFILVVIIGFVLGLMFGSVQVNGNYETIRMKLLEISAPDTKTYLKYQDKPIQDILPLIERRINEDKSCK